MASRLAQHLPSLFGPSRRAAWRLSVVRRALAGAAVLLAVQLAVGAVRPAPSASSSHRPMPKGAVLALPLTAPADHLRDGARVEIYASGQAVPVARGATVVGSSGGDGGQARATVAVAEDDVGRVVQELGAAPPATFVLVAVP